MFSATECMGDLLPKSMESLCMDGVEYAVECVNLTHCESPGSNSAITRHFCPSAIHFIHIAALDPGV